MAELYQVSSQAITQHIKAIYEEGELVQNLTCKDYLQVQSEGNRTVQRKIRLTACLLFFRSVIAFVRRGNAVPPVGNANLAEYLIKGFAMDDERLKNPPVGHSAVPDYFDEMLERIRDIRASERRVYLRVKEIFTMAADYEPSNQETTLFFQNHTE